MPDQRNNDEIDLLELFLKSVNIIQANFWLIVLFFILGSALGLAYFYSSKKIFENKMIISSDILTASYSRVLFETVNKHLGEGDSKRIASAFNISEDDAKQISSLKIENLTKADADALKETDRYLITAEVYDQSILPELQRGLISYLENNEFVKVRVEQNKTFLKEMITSTEREIKDMDNLKVRIFNGEFFQQTKGNIMFDPTSVNSKILELSEKKIKYQNDLQISNSVQLIEGFSSFQNPVKPKLSVSMAAGSMVGLFFVALLIAFKGIRKLLHIAETAK